MDDFFIGWQASASKAYALRSKQFVLALVIMLPLVAAAIVWHQHRFSTAVFEYDKTTEVEGIVWFQPVPRLRLDSGASLILIGSGKHGPWQQLEKIQHASGGTLDGKRLRLQGHLIFHDGKGLLELGDNVNPVVLSANISEQLPTPELLGQVSLCGEIADPKCFFGVMKPGEGKPHRSCAIRCISGGIPPVLKVENGHGESNYYLLKGPGGEDIHQQVLQYVADGVQVAGQLELQDDWYVLKIDPGNGILRQRPYWIGKDEMMCRNR